MFIEGDLYASCFLLLIHTKLQILYKLFFQIPSSLLLLSHRFKVCTIINIKPRKTYILHINFLLQCCFYKFDGSHPFMLFSRPRQLIQVLALLLFLFLLTKCLFSPIPTKLSTFFFLLHD